MSLTYSIGVIKSKIMFGPIGNVCRNIVARVRYRNIAIRLRKKGYGEIEILEIMIRFCRLKKHQSEKSLKDTTKYLYKLIAEASESSGIPQWDIRAKLERDFNIDI